MKLVGYYSAVRAINCVNMAREHHDEPSFIHKDFFEYVLFSSQSKRYLMTVIFF